MAERPKISVPAGELTPQEVCDYLREWARSQGYEFDLAPHGSEYGKATVRDPNGGHTTAVVPNAHHGRRLKKHQVRYTVRDVNRNWED
jgi:hypothetical protein